MTETDHQNTYLLFTADMEDLLDKLPNKNDDFCKFAMSSLIIQTFLGKSWCKENIFAGGSPHPFLDLGDNSTIQRNVFLIRVMGLAEIIYTLQGVFGFQELTNRLREKDFDTAYYEAYAAYLLHSNNYSVAFFPRKLKKGEDFDFKAFRSGYDFSVEVKSKKKRNTFNIEDSFLLSKGSGRRSS